MSVAFGSLDFESRIRVIQTTLADAAARCDESKKDHAEDSSLYGWYEGRADGMGQAADFLKAAIEGNPLPMPEPLSVAGNDAVFERQADPRNQ